MKVPMKKATLALLREDCEEVIHALQVCGEFMIIQTPQGEDIRLDTGGILTQEASAALSAMSRFREKNGILYAKPEYTVEAFERENEQDRKNVLRAIETDEQLDSVEAQLKRLTEAKNALTPFLGLLIDASWVNGTKYTRFFIGHAPADEGHGGDFDRFASEHGIEVTEFYRTPSLKYVYFSCFTDDYDEVCASLSATGFESVALPYKTGTALEENSRLSKRISELVFERGRLLQRLSVEAKNAPSVELFYDREKAKEDRAEISAETTTRAVIILGWVRADRVGAVEDAIAGATDAYYLGFDDPAEDETAPTVTKSNKIFEQYSTITDAFSLPSQNDVDPNPIMAPWYFLIFGMMMADVGYGLVAAALLYLFRRIKKPRGEMRKLVNVMLYSSIPTVFFGIVTGSYFGEELLPALLPGGLLGNEKYPGDHIIDVMIFTLIIGALHIFAGLITKAYMLIRQGRWFDAICDEFSWIVFICGCGALFVPSLRVAGTVMLCTGAAVIVLFGGREKKGIFGKLFGGLIALYGCTGFLSDILSYTRILALCLSTGIIGSVMNMLAGMVRDAMDIQILGILLSICVYLFGHALNFVLGMLSAYVHTCRLQYIEFFGKFYEGGGVRFTPLKITTKYTNIIDK